MPEDAVVDATYEVVKDSPAQEVALTKLENFSNMEEMLGMADKLIKGGMLPQSIRKPEAAVSIILMGKELGFGPMASLTQIVSVQGRATLSVHAIGALLRKAGCAWRTIEDFVPVKGPDKSTGEEKVVDYRTTIRFYRPYRDSVLEDDVSFTWQDASKMGLNQKENWSKMPKVMTYSRCFTLGARRVAPDALLGMMETAEWADVSGQKYAVNEEGHATLVVG